jgi:catechol 2,3-dioxygenase-like lactoylglutathione lyase family enzyme
MKLALARLLVFAGTASLFVLSSHAQAAKEAAKESKRPPIVGVSHIALNVDDMGAARAFYTGMLGFEEAFSLNKADGSLLLTNFKVNDHQFVQVFPGLASPTADRLNHICFETTDAEQLRAYLASKGVAEVPAKLEPGQNGALAFKVHDPDGHLVEFVQYLPGSMYANDFGKHLGARRISERIIHVGVTVKDREAADHFYKDILGFELQWHGGMKEDATDWVAMRVPDGHDWLEYMLNVHDPSPRTLGVMHHFSLGVPSVNDSYQEILKRGMKNVEPPKIGRDGKWQLNLYDPDLTRAELMEPTPVQKPCCSPILP